MLTVLANISALKLLQKAKTALVNGDYASVAEISVQILNKFGYNSVASDIQAAIDAIGSGDKRQIAVASVALVLDVINAYLGFGKPITVSASMANTDDTVATRLDLICDRIDHALAPRGFDSPQVTVDPQTILVAFQILQQAISFFYSHFRKQPAPATVVVAPQPAA